MVGYGKIDRIRRANAQRHVTPTQASNTSQKFRKNLSSQKASKSMPCVYFNDNFCNFQKHETKGVFYRHICSTCLAQDGNISVHSALDCKTKNFKKKRLTLGIVEMATEQPDCVQENDVNYCKKKQFVDRYVFNCSVCRKTVFRKEWTGWFNVNNSYKPVVSGKSFADVVRANLGQKGRGQATPLVGTQVASKPGEPLELFKENVKLSHNKKKAKFCKTTRNNQNDNFLVCNNRFEPLTEENLIADDLDMLENEIQAVDTGPGDTGQVLSSFQNEQLQDCKIQHIIVKEKS